MVFERKDRYNIADLLKIMELLRSENGCPWDKVQTHESTRKNFIEETYEVIEAIDNKDITFFIVFTPFMGIGSEVYQAVKMGRRGIGIELKESYYNCAVHNMETLDLEKLQMTIFDFLA